MFIKLFLQNPIIWDISQFIFGANKQKKSLYKSVIKNKGKLLDFGCADGNTFLAFKDFDYTGLDIDKKAIIHAKEKYRKFPNAKFVCADILKNTLPTKSFDSILFAGTAHHIADKDLFRITNSLARLLKTNGTLYFIDPVKNLTNDSKLLSLLISLDQGKFHRTASFYTKNLNKFSKNLKPIMHEIKHVNGNFMPQPKYYIAKLIKV